MLFVLYEGDSSLGCIVNPAVFFDWDWLTALLEDVLETKPGQRSASLKIKSKPLSTHTRAAATLFDARTHMSSFVVAVHTAPVVATMLAARSRTVTSHPAFWSATAVDTPPTLPPMMTTFVGMAPMKCAGWIPMYTDSGSVQAPAGDRPAAFESLTAACSANKARRCAHRQR